MLTALIHLTGTAPETERDLRTPTGHGTFHKPVVWDISQDKADDVLDRVAADQLPWVLLFWLPLMSGAAPPSSSRAAMSCWFVRGLRRACSAA